MNLNERQTRRILLVQPNPRMREAIRLLLSLEGHGVTEAEDGRRACLHYTPGDFDLVIADYAMPEMKGDELARIIKCLVPRQRILMLVAGDLPPGTPVDAVVQSPFRILELRRTVAALLSPDLPKPASPAPCPASQGAAAK